MILDRYTVHSKRRLREACNYARDDQKTNSVVIDGDRIELDSIEDAPKLLGILRNGLHLQKNLVTYHLATSHFVDELCENVRLLRAMGRVRGDGDDDVLAYVFVQSFPLGLDISDEEVRDCGLEFVQMLGKYSAVVCPHVTPVMGEDGIVRGQQKHNHILVSAFVHPSCYDGGPKKFPNDPYVLYRLRDLNDKIAIAHGLPIIRNPGKGGKNGYYETELERKGESWKGKLRNTIMRNRFFAADWAEFCDFMALDGYAVMECSARGVQRKDDAFYQTPDGHMIWGKTLGDACKRCSIEQYWNSFNCVPRTVHSEEFLSDFIYSYDGDLFARIPLGAPDRLNRDHALLRLDGNAKGDEWVWKTYFLRNEDVEIVNAVGETVKTVRGEEVVESLIDLQYPEWMQYRAQRDILPDEVRVKRRALQQERVMAQLKKREEEKKRWKAAARTEFIVKKAQDYMLTHHADGTPRSFTGMLLLFVLELLGVAVYRGQPCWVKDFKDFDPTYILHSDARLRRSYKAMCACEQYSFLHAQDAHKYVDIAKSNCRELREKCAQIEVALERLQPLVVAVSAVRNAEQILRTAEKIEDEGAREQFLCEHTEVMKKSHEAKKLLSEHNMSNEENMVRIYQSNSRLQSDLRDTKALMSEEEEWLAAVQVITRATYEAEEEMYQKRRVALKFYETVTEEQKAKSAEGKETPLEERIADVNQRAEEKPKVDVGRRKLQEFGRSR